LTALTNARRRVSRWLAVDTLVLLTLLVAIFVAMAGLLGGRFVNLYNFQSLMFSAPELGLLALAMVLSMLPGGIDLSLVAIANLAAVLAALFFRHLASSVGVPVAQLGFGITLTGFLLALTVGVVCGALNAFLITRLRVTPILATIGTSQLFSGASLVLTGGPAIQGFPNPWTAIGNDTVAGVPTPMLVMIAVFILVTLLLRRTSVGVSMTLIGVNARAARFSGVRSDAIVFGAFVLCGILASCAGILISARTNAAKSDYGSSYLLVSVLVAVLGGTNPAGGRATVIGVAAALSALTLLSSGFQMLRFSNFLVELIWGAFLLIVLSIQFLRGRFGFGQAGS
jgi:simple sugar transport system permease protein